MPCVRKLNVVQLVIGRIWGRGEAERGVWWWVHSIVKLFENEIGRKGL
jgi:hypothetical protein